MTNQLLRATTLAAATILFAGGCGEAPTGTVTELQTPELAKGGKPMDTVPLTMAFTDDDNHAVTSDGGGVYFGIFRENGSFIAYATNDRKLCFEFPANSVPWGSVCYVGYISTTGRDLHAMVDGDVATTAGGIFFFIPTVVRKKVVNVMWRLSFGMSCDLVWEPERNMVVNRTPDTWIISGGPDEANHPILCGEDGKVPISTVLDMPFELTLALVP